MKKIFISLAMALSIVSCSTDELSNGGGTLASDKGSVQLVLSTDDMASRTVDESAIQDVNILEYVNGVLATDEVVYLSGKDFSKPVNVSGLKEFTATSMDNGEMNEGTWQNFIFVVANYGKKIEDREAVSTFEKLKEFKMNFSGKKTMANLPMTGFYFGGINDNSTTQMNVNLQRAVAKVNFTLDTSNFAVDNSAPSQLVINSIKLCNVPGNITLYPCQDRPSLPINGETVKWNSENGHTPFPTKEEMEAEGGSVTYDDEQNQSADANTANTYTYVAYIPENARGSYSNITDNSDKHPSKCDTSISEEDEKDENKEKSYTHIFVDLNYAGSDGIGKRATYRIYLGGNSTGDMNLLRNTQYNITTLLYGANSADTRISVCDDETKGSPVLEPANCYMVDMDDVVNGTQFFIPLSQVTKGWEKIIKYDATQSDTKTKVDEMLKSGKWEIKTLWKTWDGSTNVKGTIAAGSTADNPIARLVIPTNIENGNNAVVELVSTEDQNVYWSWHLWFTDYKPEKSTDAERHGKVHQYPVFATLASGIYKDRYIMDRNLGATITGVSGDIIPTTNNAVKYLGLFYQFGRKDPFIGSKATSGTTFADCYNADGTEKMPTPYASAKAGSASTSFLAKAVMNPTTFYTSSGNWTKESTGLWAELNGSTEVDKSPFDPCPPGWRVPINGTWNNFTSYFGWGLNGVPGRRYTYNNINAWYPASGSILNDGTLYGVGYGYYWSATPNCYFLGFLPTSGDVWPSNSGGSVRGCIVRCIQE